MDKYTKFVLSIIAVGILGINYHLFKGEIISPVHAAGHEVHKITICNVDGSKCAGIAGKKHWLRIMTTKY